MKLGSKLKSAASKWLEKDPGNAIYGLLPLVAEKGKLAEAAIEFLRTKNKQGCTEFIRQSLAKMSPEVAEAVKREILDHEEITYPAFEIENAQKPLKNAFAAADLAKVKIPTWVAPEMLPPILINNAALAHNQLDLLLKAIKASKFDEIHPLVAAVKEFANRNSLAVFAWKIFETWLGEGAPSKENWTMTALGLLGNDDTVLKLTPLVRVWPGESQHKRAVIGLQCLRAIGTDTALMQLNGISQKLKFQGLKKQAKEFMEEIAKSRGMSRSELEDRVVPDCELDEKGKRIFDFGPRQFEFCLGPDLKPMVRGEDGKFKPDLPKPNAKDDPDKAAEATADWKRMKKQIREVLKLQSARIEEAMISGRSWTLAEFEQLLLGHPLMRHLIRLVLWGTYDAKGKLVSVFRVSEEFDCADENDGKFEFPVDNSVRIRVVHPLSLSEPQKKAWGEIISDYEMISPFMQLGREVNILDPTRGGMTEIIENPIGKIAGVSLSGLFEKYGWERAIPADGGGYYEHTKPFPGADITAVCQYEPGLFAGGGPDYWEDQNVTNFFFIPGIYSPDEYYPEHKKRLKLQEVDPIVFSEATNFLKLLESKAK